MIREKEFLSKPYITDEMIEIVRQVMKDGVLSGARATNLEGGKYVRLFEGMWAQVHKVKHAIAVNSGTSGLITAIKALDLPADSIFGVSPFSFSASWSAIELAGYDYTFIDVDLETMCMDVNSKRGSVDAYLPVHWNGNFCNFNTLKPVIEDACQCPGIESWKEFIGTFVKLGVVSLNEPKNIATGEGGVIMTDDDELAYRCKLIRNHGENIDSMWLGYNFRMTEIQAAIGVCQLDNLAYLNNIRRRNWLYLKSELEKYRDILVPQRIINRDSFSPYCVAFRWLRDDRDKLVDFLRKNGIPVSTGVNFLPETHYCPNAVKLQKEQYLGFYQVGYPNSIEDMDDIVKGFKEYLK